MRTEKVRHLGTAVLILVIISLIGLLMKRAILHDQFTPKIIKICQNELPKSRCYDRELPKLMNTLSMEEVFVVTKNIQAQDTAYPYCHTLGHALATIETKKDPTKWKEVIARCPSGVCSNGCIHGAFQERFRTESMPDDRIAEIKPELMTVCEARENWRPTGLERASCYHALGHLLMYITQADIVRSTDLCDAIANTGGSGDFRNVCYDGAFMQIFQPLEPDDLSLIRGKEVDRQGHDMFCRRFFGEKQTSCITEGWPLYISDLQQPEGLVKLCSKLTDQYRDRCINGLFYILVVQLRFDLPSIKDYCLGLPESYRGRCFAMTASRLIETDYDNVDKAIAWCKGAGSQDIRATCFQEFVKESDFIFHPGSEKFSTLCSKVPEEWQKKCLEKNVKK
ncbi:hypothetical protein HY086_03920 [Candidatus Gottesmanbacteria bacterium]|nr:hypothetical protein [Candidatus Gottesmanbacteria bacterium]